MKTKIWGLLALALATLPGAAQAEGLSYSYIDLFADHISPDSQSGLDSGNAEGVFASVALPADLAVIGSYEHSSQDIKFVNLSLSNDIYTVGVSWHYSFTERLDLVPSLRYISDDASAGSFSNTSHGYVAGLGLRGLVTDSLELNGGFKRTHYNATTFTVASDINSVDASLIYSFNQSWALGGEYDRSTSNGFTTTTYEIIGRFMF